MFLHKYIKDLYNCGNEPVFGITDYTLTKFIKTYVGKQFTPKDFRTLRANILAYRSYNNIVDFNEPITKKEWKSCRTATAEEVSKELNNTTGVCLKSYIDANLFADNL